MQTLNDYLNIQAMRVSEIKELAINTISDIIGEKNNPKDPAESLRIGTGFHSLILRDRNTDELPENIAVLDFKDWRSAKAKEVKQQYRENRETDFCPLLAHELRAMEYIIEERRIDFDDIFNASKGEFEKAFVGELEGFGKIKGKLDYVTDDCVYDLKTCNTLANLDKRIFDLGYQLQMYLYMQLAGKEKAKLVFLHILSGAIAIKRLDYFEIKDECEALLERARKNQQALDLYNSMGDIEIQESDYIPPQWAIAELLKVEDM